VLKKDSFDSIIMVNTDLKDNLQKASNARMNEVSPESPGLPKKMMSTSRIDKAHLHESTPISPRARDNVVLNNFRMASRVYTPQTSSVGEESTLSQILGKMRMRRPALSRVKNERRKSNLGEGPELQLSAMSKIKTKARIELLRT
jgi:hypothetical protein